MSINSLSPKQILNFREMERSIKRGKFPYEILEDLITTRYKEENRLEEYLDLKKLF